MAEKKYTENLGLTKQDETDFVDGPEISRSFSVLDEVIGKLEKLNTEEKGSLIGAINQIKKDLTVHTGNKSNPHGVTKSQVGLGNVPNVKIAYGSGQIKDVQSSYKDQWINFGITFSSPPLVIATLSGTCQNRTVCAADTTNSGCNMRAYVYDGNTAVVYYAWVAIGV